MLIYRGGFVYFNLLFLQQGFQDLFSIQILRRKMLHKVLLFMPRQVCLVSLKTA